MTTYVPYQAKKCKFFVNGDNKFYGKQCVVNPKRTRNFDAFLQELTTNLKTTRPVRNIRTPVGGHIIRDMADLENNGAYVAGLGQSDKFKKIGYLDLGAGMAHFKGSTSPRDMQMLRRSPSSSTAASSLKQVKPVEHSKLYRCSGRIRKIPTSVTTIFVYRNGLELTPPARITIPHQMTRFGWEAVFQEIQSRLRSTMNGAPKKLVTVEGRKVGEVAELKNMESYVLVCMGDYRGFRKANYGRPPPHSHTSPQTSRKSYHGVRLEPISKQRRRKDDSDSDSYPTSTGSSDKSKTPKSTPLRKPVENRPRPRREPVAKKEDDGVFHARAVKHKRTPENTRQVDFDKDEGGVFKAKQKNTETVDAVEVEDTKDTKVDLPIDQVEAEEVVEEDIPGEEDKLNHTYNKKERTETQKKEATRTPRRDRTETQKRQSSSPQNNTNPKQDAAATTIQAGVRGHLARKEVTQKREDKKLRDAAAAQALEDSAKEYKEAKARKAEEETKREAAATTIQAGLRGVRDRGKVKALKEEQNVKAARNKLVQEEMAATAIQAGFRGHKARQEVKDIKNAKEKEQAATTIQAGYRGYKDRKIVKGMKNQEAKKEKPADEQAHSPVEEKKDDQDQAATKIQAGYRSYRDRKKVKAIKEAKAEPQITTEQQQSAVKIQKNIRGYQDRKRVKALKSAKKKENAATTIQANYRGYTTRKALEKQQGQANEVANSSTESQDSNPHTEDQDAAVKIQKTYRGYQDRKKVRAIKSANKKDEAATKIQASYRGHMTRKNMTKPNDLKVNDTDGDNEEVKEEMEQKDAALKIQKNVRGYQTRKKLRAEKSARKKTDAAVKIQSNYRGYHTRKELANSEGNNKGN